MTTRELTQDGLSPLKNRDWNKRELVLHWREAWADFVNDHLQRHGHDARVDHRSYKEQGIEMEAQPKRGRNIIEMEKRLRTAAGDFLTAFTDKGKQFEATKLRNFYRILSKPETVFEIITKGQATFMWGDVQKVLARYIDDEVLFHRLDARLRDSKLLVPLAVQDLKGDGAWVENKVVYTVKGMVDREVKLVQTAESLAAQKVNPVDEQQVERTLATFDAKYVEHGGLSKDQKAAIRHMVSDAQLVCIQGYAGSGKSTVVGVAKEIWEASGYRVYGLAPTGRARENLAEKGISSQTVHKFLKDYNEGRNQLKPNSVLVLDEAGMLDVERSKGLLEAVQKQGVKLVMMGDSGQLQPVEAGPAFRLVTGRVGDVRLETILRQQIDWQKDATQLFGKMQTRDALQMYQDRGHVTFVNEDESNLALQGRVHTILERHPQLGDPKLGAVRFNLEDSKDQADQAFLQKHQLLDDPERICHLADLFKKSMGGGDRAIVENYNLSRRIAGSIFLAIKKDVTQMHPDIPFNKLWGAVRSHKDYELFQDWQYERKRYATEMLKRIDTCRPLMKELGVDPVSFAKNFLRADKEGNYDKNAVRAFIKEQNLPRLDSDASSPVCSLRNNTKKELMTAWNQSMTENAADTHIILTNTRRDSDLLNTAIRTQLKETGLIDRVDFTYSIKVAREDDFRRQRYDQADRSFSKGDRLLFMRNDKSLGVSNGNMGTILELENNKIRVKLDGEEGKEVSFAPKLYPYFDLGWAMNIYRAQGITIDRMFFLATFEQYRNLAYVAMTRHVKDLRVFASKLDFWRSEKLVEALSNSSEKLSSFDYFTNPRLLQKSQEEDGLLTKVFGRVGTHLEAMKYVSKRTVETLGETFLGHAYERDIALADGAISEQDRAKEVLSGQQTLPESLKKRLLAVDRVFGNDLHVRHRIALERFAHVDPKAALEILQNHIDVLEKKKVSPEFEKAQHESQQLLKSLQDNLQKEEQKAQLTEASLALREQRLFTQMALLDNPLTKLALFMENPNHLKSAQENAPKVYGALACLERDRAKAGLPESQTLQPLLQLARYQEAQRALHDTNPKRVELAKDILQDVLTRFEKNPAQLDLLKERGLNRSAAHLQEEIQKRQQLDQQRQAQQQGESFGMRM